MSAERPPNGFTLIEVLVALAVFSLAAIALLRLQGVTLTSAATLESRTVGQIVARNLAVEAMTDPVAPSLGRSEGSETNAGRAWRWSRTVARMGEPRLLRIDIAVVDEAGDPAGALTVIRPAA